MPRGARAKRRAAEPILGASTEVVAPPVVAVEPSSLTLEQRGERVLAMRAELAEAEAQLVADLRAAGVSWERIGWVLRRPSETVRRRYGPPSAGKTPSSGFDEPLPLDL